MNLRLNSFLVFFSFFPVWFFKFKIYKIDIFFISIFLIVLFFLIIYSLSKIQKLSNKFYYYFFLSGIIFFGLDNYLSLHREVTHISSFVAQNLGGIYYSSLLLVAFLFLIILFILLKINQNGVKIFSVTIFTLAIFSFISSTKSIDNLKTFNLQTKEQANLPTIVIIFDEMSGLNSYESQTKEGKIFDKKAKEISKKNNLILYEKIYTNNRNTIFAISSLFNFETVENLEKNKIHLKNENSIYANYSLMLNKFFDKFKNISVFQTHYLNYCENKNVQKCKSFNPFDNIKYITGFKDTTLTHYINAWKFDGSITALLSWRILRHYELIDVTLSGQGEKASILFYLDKIIYDIKSKNFDLIVAHTLVPHKPYGYNKKCEHQGFKSLNNYNNKLSIETHTLYHNIDRICTIQFIDNFLNKIENENIKYKKIVFLSDHGSRNLQENPESVLNNILIIKDPNSKFRLISQKKILQDEFKKLFENF